MEVEFRYPRVLGRREEHNIRNEVSFPLLREDHAEADKKLFLTLDFKQPDVYFGIELES